MASPAPSIVYVVTAAPTTAIASATYVYAPAANKCLSGGRVRATNTHASATRTLAVYVSLPADHTVRVLVGSIMTLLASQSADLPLPHLAADQRVYLVASGDSVNVVLDGVTGTVS